MLLLDVILTQNCHVNGTCDTNTYITYLDLTTTEYLMFEQ